MTERICKDCHGIENIIRAKRTKENGRKSSMTWSPMVPKEPMPKFDLVTEYLSTHFGPITAAKVNVNKATWKELTAGLKISAQDAEAIVLYRAEKGPFKSMQDLTGIHGIDAKKIEGVQDRIEF